MQPMGPFQGISEIGQASGHADHGSDLRGAIIVHAHHRAGDYHVVAQVVGEQGPDGPVDQTAGQHGGERGLALPAHEGAGDTAHGVQLFLEVHAQGEEVDAVPGTGGGGDGDQHTGFAVGHHGGSVGQLGHFAHLNLEGPAGHCGLIHFVIGKLLVLNNG